MSTERDRHDMRRRLEEEWAQAGVTFDEKMRSEVLEKAAKKNSFWNKQIAIPVPVALLVAGILAGAILWAVSVQSKTFHTLDYIQKIDNGGFRKDDINSWWISSKKLVTIGGYTFYESELTKRKGSPS